MTIIWTCLARVVLCTYSTLHLNPGAFTDFWENVFLGILSIITPDVILISSFQEFIGAREVFNAALMNGVSLTFRQAHLIHMKGVKIQQGTSEATQLLTSSEDLLNALAIPRIQQTFPSDTEIKARSNGDSLSKLLTLMQLLWFSVQAISRHIQGKAVSLLEVTTLAFISMSIVTNLFWFKKPRGLSSAIVIHNDSPVRRNWGIKTYEKSNTIIRMAFVVSFVMFGAIHLLAWNYAFPSTTEKWLWRISSLLIITLPCIASIHPGLLEGNFVEYPCWVRMILCIFALARLYLVVEAFLVFRSVPSSVYETVDWSAYFIHF